MTFFDDTGGGKVFGNWDAPVTDYDDPIDPPVGEACMYCQEQIEEGDSGRIQSNGFVVHRECSLRSPVGGIGHQVDHARYCRGELGPDAGLSYRQSSLMVWNFFHETLLSPTPEQLAIWRDRVERAR